MNNPKMKLRKNSIYKNINKSKIFRNKFNKEVQNVYSENLKKQHRKKLRKNIPCSRIGRLNIVKTASLPQTTSGQYSSYPIPADVFVGIGKPILISIWNFKAPRITLLKKEEQSRITPWFLKEFLEPVNVSALPWGVGWMIPVESKT